MDAGYGKNWNPSEYYKDMEIAKAYDRERFSSVSGRVFNKLEQSAIRKAFVDINPGSDICDIPCGTGRLAQLLLELGYNVVGADISPMMLAVAQEKLAHFGDKFTTLVSDAKVLHQQPRRFDAVLCARVLMHFPLPEQIEFLRGVSEVSRGRVVFTGGINSPYHRFRRSIKRALGNQAPAVYPLSQAELSQLIRDAGLKEIRRHYVLPGVSESVVVVAERRQ